MSKIETRQLRPRSLHGALNDPSSARLPRRFDPVVVLGASTGGVEAIEFLLKDWPADGPALLIVQHMPAFMLEHFVDRLDQLSSAHVTLAYSGAPVERGHVYVAPGGAFHLEVAAAGGGLCCMLVEGDPQMGHRPSVDRLFCSALPLAPRLVGVLLTGMGRDGADGLRALRDAHCWTIAQDRDSCVVFGMPAAAIRKDAAVQVCALSDIPEALKSAIAKTESAKPAGHCRPE